MKVMEGVEVSVHNMKKKSVAHKYLSSHKVCLITYMAVRIQLFKTSVRFHTDEMNISVKGRYIFHKMAKDLNYLCLTKVSLNTLAN